MPQCQLYDVAKERCEDEGTNEVKVGNPRTGYASTFHFCDKHVQEAKAAAERAKPKEKADA